MALSVGNVRSVLQHYLETKATFGSFSNKENHQLPLNIKIYMENV